MARLPNTSQGNRREDLLEIATRLFSRRGFHGASMGDIAAQMGIQKSSLYHWVDSKGDMLYQVLSGVLDSLYAQA